MMTKLKNENILKTFSIARKNRYQVLEDGGLAIKEEDKEIGRDFQIMEKTYTEVAERVLERPRKRNKPWISDESWNLVDTKGKKSTEIFSAHDQKKSRDNLGRSMQKRTEKLRGV